jgi:ATP-dependent phosphofructokinase / diphosphate-dependent phosphofructokinase
VQIIAKRGDPARRGGGSGTLAHRMANPRIGILTGGGDCPGLNAVIRAVTRRSLDRGYEVIGVLHGWRGMIEGAFRPLDSQSISGILPRGGTILRTSRTNPYKVDGGLDRVVHHLKGFDGLVAIGGEDTLGVASRLHAEQGAPVVGVPKTIDNDLSATDYTFGFDTAVSIVTEAIDRLHTTAESHDRVMVVEVMGRHAGWIAVHSGIAGGADAILIPELPVEIESCCDLIEGRHARGKDFSIVVVAEGYVPPGDDLPAAEVDQFGHPRLGGIGERVAREIEKRTGYETRVSTLGHVQRGGSPTAFDRVLATRFGCFAADLVHEGQFGQMASLRGIEIVGVPLESAVTELKTVPQDLYDLAATFFA